MGGGIFVFHAISKNSQHPKLSSSEDSDASVIWSAIIHKDSTVVGSCALSCGRIDSWVGIPRGCWCEVKICWCACNIDCKEGTSCWTGPRSK
jgi:hypothetical protein